MKKNYHSEVESKPLTTKHEIPIGRHPIFGPPIKASTGWLLMLLLLSLFTGIGMNGQSMANYTFSGTTNGSLENIDDGTSIMTAAVHDDDATLIQPIGFDFYYMGVLYSHFSANSNGQVRLHPNGTSTVIGGSAVSSYSSGTVTLAAMGGDNETGAGMKMKIVGSAPNRKLVIEWTKFYVYFTDPVNNAGNMQMWLSENGVISYVYGEMYNSSTSSQNRAIFLSSGSTAGQSAHITIGATPAIVTTSTFPATNLIAGGSGTPTATTLIANLGTSSNSNRIKYTFTPAGTAGHATVTSLAAPTALTINGVSASSMTINWTAASPANGIIRYAVFNSTDGGVTY
ncbi:MAG: hypothetical protein EOO92_26350, partial [Pedobacter sp.]